MKVYLRNKTKDVIKFEIKGEKDYYHIEPGETYPPFIEQHIVRLGEKDIRNISVSSDAMTPKTRNCEISFGKIIICSISEIKELEIECK